MEHTSPSKLDGNAQPLDAEAALGRQSKYDLDRLPKEITDLIPQGRFAEYHIKKAWMALANRDFATAKYQIEASLRHESSREAKDLLSEIRRQTRAK